MHMVPYLRLFTLITAVFCITSGCTSSTDERRLGDVAEVPTPMNTPEIATPTRMTLHATQQGVPTPQDANDLQGKYALTVTDYRPGNATDCGLPHVTATSTDQETIHVFFACTSANGLEISAVPARAIQVSTGENPKKVALQALFAGATLEETLTGYYTFFGPDTEDIPFTVTVDRTGLAVVTLDRSIRDIVHESDGRRLRAFVSDIDTIQIVTTLGQFPDVNRVTIFIGDQPLCKVRESC